MPGNISVVWLKWKHAHRVKTLLCYSCITIIPGTWEMERGPGRPASGAPSPERPHGDLPASGLWLWILVTQVAHERLLIRKKMHKCSEQTVTILLFLLYVHPLKPIISLESLVFTVYYVSLQPIFLAFICTYISLDLFGLLKYPPHSVLQFVFSCFPDVLEIFPHQFLYVCPIHFNGCLTATRQLAHPPPTEELIGHLQ